MLAPKNNLTSAPAGLWYLFAKVSIKGLYVKVSKMQSLGFPKIIEQGFGAILFLTYP